MANLIKTGSAIFKVGNTVMQQNKDVPFYQSSNIAGFNAPWRCAVDETNNKLYVTSTGSNYVSVVNLSSLVTTTFSVGGGSYGVAVDNAGNRLFIGKSGSINVYNLSTLALITSFSSSGVAYDISIDFTNGYLYACNTSAFFKYDLVTYALVQTITQAGSYGISVDPYGNRLFVVFGNAPYYINTYTLSNLAATPVSFSASTPIHVLVDLPSNFIYVSNNSPQFSVLNYTNPAAGILKTVSTSGQLLRGLAFSSSKVYCADQLNNTVYILNKY